ncbi:LysR family transcriptional regulator [Atlantibacter subterranea]|uniref:LysR family transcriptional regulator n=2 Tax=Atlantibacter subterraneus TaxID=255519 RepID=A0A427V8J8_9ENTR|nr:LysR family transcriptional regulator [Atlantibacter subterranea]MDA3131571.1 LysR family transcriptional regulator [Atlantibacter subterranea]RSB64256.1 LysR family transcriptional regulator [Atlantibacter subterranea]RSE07954.1 LysR family transcriptional regulator [Atlantibacter subterranea]RSE29060.1 LysR family transcriptional regulator [Atlantibacter subterranea]
MANERIDRIELMNTFIRIIESGSLSAAAVQLNTTQATVSRRLKSLEEMLGCKLLLRTTHAMKLTDDGERCYQHAKTVTGHWMMLEDDLRNAGDEPVGTLRVRAPHAFGQQQLIAPLTQFLRQYPQMNVEWMLNDKAPLFVTENIDCAIHLGAQPDPSTISVLLAEVPRIVVAAPELLAGYPQIDQPEALTALPWVALNLFYQQEVTLRQVVGGETRTLAIAPRLSTDSLYAVRETVLAGLGVGIVSAWIVAQDLEQGKLVHVLPEWQAAPLPVWLAYPYSRYYPARLRKFLELMREILPGLMGMQPPERRKKSRSSRPA